MADADGNKATERSEDVGKGPGPSGVVLSVRSWFGPLARLFPGRHLELGRAIVPLVGTEGMNIDEVSADPLRTADSGIEAGGRLEARAEPTTIAPGKAGRLVLRGQVPAWAGRYLSAVRLLSARDKPMVIPVTIEVSASPVWGIGFMVLGLMALGLVNVLATEGALRSKQRDVLQAAQAFHEWVERSPVPQRREVEANEIGRAHV